MTRRGLAALACAASLALAAPALAETNKDTPGAPCVPGGGLGTGNPCDGNQGNPSPEGNAGEKITRDKHPDPFVIARPNNDRGAFINQIGDLNAARIAQSANSQYARIDQSGDRNAATVGQVGAGAHYATVSQDGDDNLADLTQSGTGAQVALLAQTGNGNRMDIDQIGGVTSGGVQATQNGDRNAMALTQNGEGNQARLTQNGSDSAMTAVQNGNANQLTWVQTGNGLSDLAITQSGAQALLVTQTK
jgi:hypothetical protein